MQNKYQALRWVKLLSTIFILLLKNCPIRISYPIMFWLDDLGVGNSYSNALGLRDQRQFSTVKKYMLSCFFFMLSWIMFFFSFSFSMLLWKTNLTFLSIYIYDFKIVLPCYFDSGRVIFLEKFNRSSFIVVLNLYGTNILQIQSILYIKATQWKLKMWPFWAVAFYIQVKIIYTID